MNNKTLWTVGIVVTLALVGGLALFILIVGHAANTPSDTTTLPSTNTGNSNGNPGNSTVTVPGNTQNTGTTQGVEAALQSGGTITVNDFKKDPETKAYPDNSLYYLSGGLTPSASTTAYSTFYVEADKSFHITLLREPLRDSRDKAEKDLLTKLGITETQACSLVVYVGVPGAVNQYFAGKELGLSFCPGAEAL